MRWTLALVLVAACSADSSATSNAEAPGPEPVATASTNGNTATPRAVERAFEQRAPFPPLPDPQPGDWLAEHEEKGQTFAQYLKSPLAAEDPSRPNLYIQPIGTFEDDAPSLEALDRIAEAYFGLPVEFLPVATEKELALRSRRHDGHRQFHAGSVLDGLRTRVPRDARVVLAVTMTDLYPEDDWNFVFGQASLSDRVGVFSFARYSPAFYGDPVGPDTGRLVLERAAKVMLHEMGHALGLSHCIEALCLMNGSNHLEEADAAPLHVCPSCLRKLHHALRFDPVKRYESLATTYADLGLRDAASFVDARATELSND